MNPMTAPSLRRPLLQLVCLCGLRGAAVLLLTALPSFAQTPASPAGGVPTASQLQRAHNLGQDMAAKHFDEEVFPHGGPPPKDLLRPKFDEFMNGPGSRLSEAEKEVFTEAYWNKYEKKSDRFQGGMTQIDPPNLLGPGTASTTNVSGKTSTPGPGTLQLTDDKGNSYFFDVDANGNYSGTVPLGNFHPDRMTFRSGTLKAAWKLDDSGKWTQISSASGTTPAAAALYALLDECNRPVLVASQTSDAHTTGILSHESQPPAPSPLRLVRLFGLSGSGAHQEGPPVRLVNDPLPPEAVREAQKQGIDHADQQFEKSQLEKIPKGSRTQAQNDRLDKLNDMLKDYDNAKKSPFANKEAIDIAEKAAQARWLQRQAQALRASGTPGAEKTAQGLENQAKQLLGGQDPPPLRASAQEPLQFSSALGQEGTASHGTRLVAAGQSGYAMMSSPTSSVGQGIKGHSRLVATGEIQKQTTTELELESLAQLEEEPSETTTFAQYLGYDFTTGAWGKPNFNLGAQWSVADGTPPHVASVGQDGAFAFSDWDVSPKTCYRLNYGVGFNYVSTPLSPKNPTGTYELTVNANRSWIAAFNTTRISDGFYADAMDEGAVDGSRYEWTGYYTRFDDAPFIASGQISDEGYNRFSWRPDLREFMAYGETNPGVLPQPVPGLDREEWPDNEAESMPSLTLPGSWLEN